MSKVLVQIKWGKQVYSDVELNFEEDITTFKCQIYALTNIPVDKQKIMCKGKIIKDDNEWTDYPNVKEGAILMLMGTAEGKELKAPETSIQFLEDMSAQQKAKALQEKAGVFIPAGLENLGNTCYMNSVVQSFKRVNELKDIIKDFKVEGNANKGDPSVILTEAARGLMQNLENKGESFAPEIFVNSMRRVFPMFDETDNHGHHKQQDAEECFTMFLRSFQQAIKAQKGTDEREDVEMTNEENKFEKDKDPVGHLFGLELESTFKNTESEEEPSKVVKEEVLKLSCHIDNNNNPIDSLQDGLKISLEGIMEKYSDVLKRNSVYKKTSKVNRLPSYVCVQFVRFYWKKESVVGGTKAGKAKILRSVFYPKVLDLYNFCSDSLKLQLDKARALEQKNREADDKAILEGKKQQAVENDKMLKGEGKTQTEEEKEQDKLVGQALKIKQAQEAKKKHDQILYRPHGQGSDSGNYELVAVVTHKGRSADGGHYVGWVHASGDDWLCFDDDLVSTVKIDEILALKGGGDWHTAYLCIYRKLEVVESDFNK